MGNCIRRETGIELEDENGDMLNHKDMRENIMKMKSIWKDRVRQKEEIRRETENKEIFTKDLNLSYNKDEEEVEKYEEEVHNFEEDQEEEKEVEKSIEQSVEEYIPEVKEEEKVVVKEEKPVLRAGLPRIPVKRKADTIVLRKYDSNENYKDEGEDSFVMKYR